MRVDGIESRLEYDREVIDAWNLEVPAKYVLSFELTAASVELVDLEQILQTRGLAGPISVIEKLFDAMAGVPGQQTTSKVEGP